MVEIKKMDFLIKDEDPSVIKIDVEGYDQNNRWSTGNLI